MGSTGRTITDASWYSDMNDGERGESTTGQKRPAANGKWWLVLLVEVVAGLVFVTGVGAWLIEGGFQLVGSSGGVLGGPQTLSYVIFVIPLHVLAPAAVYFDRKYVATVSEWTPSRLYYLTFVTGLGDMLAIVYLLQRHRYLGTP